MTPAELDQEVIDVYRAQSRTLQGFLRNLGCPASQVEDICQDAFLAVRLRMDQAHIASLEAYLFQVARNRFHRLNGKRSAHDLLCEDPTDPNVPEPATWDDVDQRHALQPVLDELTSRQRQVIFLRFHADLSEGHIAEILGVTRGTVKKTLSDAKQKVRKRLREDPHTWEGDL